MLPYYIVHTYVTAGGLWGGEASSQRMFRI